MGKHIRPVVRALLYEQGQTMLDRAIAAQAKDRKTVTVDAAYVDSRLIELSRNEDLSRYVL